MESTALEEPLNYGPDFICIGAQKSCTSWLHWNLLFHPETSMPPEKEINYFCCEPSTWRERYTRLMKAKKNEFPMNEIFPMESFPFTWYEHFLFTPHTAENYCKLFPKPLGKISGDLSPTYCLLPPQYIEALSKKLPDVKIIYLLRNPIDRTWSQFRMMKKNFLLTHSEDSEIIHYIKNEGCLDHSRYTSILNVWELYFPGRVKVWFYDQICKNPKKIFKEICAYLNISPQTNFLYNKIKSKVFEGSSIPMPINVEKYLSTEFQEELISLHQHFNNIYTKQWLNKDTSALSKIYSWYRNKPNNLKRRVS